MTPSEWQRVKKVFDLAIDQPAEAQIAFVAESPEPPQIKAEVQRLLHALASSDGFLQQPAIDLHDLVATGDENPVLSPGALVARRFEITRFLSRGGMGEVYEAWDQVLRQTVALKTIRPRIAQRPEVIERFKREVRHSRELSHPNICRVHELFAHETGTGEPPLWVLSMELLNGPTLRESLHDKGPMEPRRALEVALQLIAGLDAAHQHGLVHRDFKSANVMLVPGPHGGTRAVITDFGLSSRLANAEDPDAPAEQAGVGTPGYMAPEQETGCAEVGPLADQYALGAVLCEMLTAELPQWVTPQRRKPPRADPAHTSASGPPSAPRVVEIKRRRTQGKVLRLPEHRYPKRWEETIRCCLQQDPAQRFENVQAVAKSLTPPGVLGTPLRRIAALLLVTLAVAGSWWWHREQTRCRICDIVQLTPDTDQSEEPSLSRDGKMIAYSSDRAESGNLDIFSQVLPDGRPVRLTHDRARDSEPSISPDGSFVAFRSERDGGGVYLADTRAGSERLLVPGAHNPQISPDGRSLLYWVGSTDPSVANGRLFVTSLIDGKVTPIASEFPYARNPVWSSDARRILFSGCQAFGTACPEWWVVNADGSHAVKTGAVSLLETNHIELPSPGAGAWRGNEVIFSGRAGEKTSLWSLKLDADLRASSPPRLLLEGDARLLAPTVSSKNDIAFTRISGAMHIWQLQHADDLSKVQLSKVTLEMDLDGTPFVSEGGRYLVFVRVSAARRYGIWVRDTRTGMETLLYESKLAVQTPIISSDGKWVAFDQSEQDGRSVYAGPAHGPYRQVCTHCFQPSGWFRGEQEFLIRKGTPSVLTVANARSGELRPLLSRPGVSIGDAVWSQTTGLLLFTAVAAEGRRVYATRLQGDGTASQDWIEIASHGSPDHPRWSTDGRFIYYVANRSKEQSLFRQAFLPAARRVLGDPVTLMDFHQGRASIDDVADWTFNLSADGTTLYFNMGEQNSAVRLGRL